MFKLSEQMRKVSVKNYFWRSDFTLFMSKSFQIRDNFFTLLFPKDSKNLESLEFDFGRWGKKILKWSLKHLYQKSLLSKAKFSKKLTFCVAILHHLLVQVFKSEATFLRYFSPRILNL